MDLEKYNPYIHDISATFMIYNLSKQLVGYQRYNPNNESLPYNNINGKYYTYRRDLIGVWGLESYDDNQEYCFVTEGIFDACRLAKYNVNSLALLSNSPNSSVSNFLFCLSPKIVIIKDNDKAGDLLVKSLKGVYSHVEVAENKDLGDSSEEFVKNLVDKYRK